MNSKFDFYEVAKINSEKSHLSPYNGKFVVITGKSQSEEDPTIWAYSVKISGLDESHFIFEEDLDKTGKSVKAGYVMSTEVIKLDSSGNVIDDEE